MCRIVVAADAFVMAKNCISVSFYLPVLCALAYKHALIQYYCARLYVGFRLKVVDCLGAESRYDLIISIILLACSRFLFYTILSVPRFLFS